MNWSVFHLAITRRTISKTVCVFLIKVSRRMLLITHRSLYEDSGKITFWCLIIRNNPASRFDLEGTMIHTADCVSLTALPPENAEPDL